MAFYTRDRRNFVSNYMDYLDFGSCADVFYDGDIIFKKYYPQTLNDCRLSVEMFDILKTIDNPHFIELLDIYHDYNFIEKLKSIIGLLPFSVDAYTAKYYSDNSIDVLLEPKDYILENFRELELLISIFNENGICVRDLKRANTIIGKQGIVVIDPDLFYISSSSVEEISKLNRNWLLGLLRDIVYHSLLNKANCKENTNFLDLELFNFGVTGYTDITDYLSKKMKYIKKPLELFKK